MSLADYLRSQPDEELAVVLRARPDLASPAPESIQALAARAQSRLSTARALEGLDRFTLEILDGLRALGDSASVATLAEWIADDASPQAIHHAIDALRQRVLVFPADPTDPATLRVAPGVDECCSPYPAGLGRPAAALSSAAAALASDPVALTRALSTAPPQARHVLDRLSAGPPVGAVTDAQRPAAGQDEESPVRWLIARCLLVPTSDTTVELPREVGLALRRPRPLGELHPTPPERQVARRNPEHVDTAGAGQAMETVRQTEALLEALGAEPAPVLRSGGLGVRDLRRLARAAGVAEALAGLLLETAATAGLLDDDRATEPLWLPTTVYDRWLTLDLASRWMTLANAWLTMTRQPGVVGQRDERERLINVLSGDAERIAAPSLRLATLQLMAELPEGDAAIADDVTDQLAWHAPRRGGRQRDESARWAAAQAADLGLIGLGALTSYARLLVTSGQQEAVATLDKMLPAPVDHILVQADLTVVVPGPPEPGLAAELALAAEPESSGAATVYRVTPQSVRRALDAGMTANELHEFFTRRSTTPAPQALTYLINDTARRHGGIRVGPAGAYLRSDDESRLAEVLADRRLAELSLRRLASTVLVTRHSSARLLSALREAGYAPAPEDTSGAVVLTTPTARRASGRTRAPAVSQVPELGPAQAAQAVKTLRRNDAATAASRRGAVALGSGTAGPVAETLAVLQRALQARSEVWVSYVDAHGSNASRLVTPVSMGGGYLRAEDGRTDMAHTFALHRITSAALPE